MITQRNLDTIGPRPPRYLRRPQPAGADPTLAGGRLTLTDEGSAGTSPVLHADSRPDAFSTHASLRHPPSPSAPAAHATTTGSGAA